MTMIIFWFFSSVFFPNNNNNPNTFTDWNNTNEIVSDKQIKPVLLKNVYSISLKVSNFVKPNDNWIIFKTITHWDPNQVLHIGTITKDSNDYFSQNITDTNKTEGLLFDQADATQNPWQINFLYNIQGFYMENNNLIKKIGIFNFPDLNWTITIEGDYPFDLILYNYKYDIKKNHFWKQKYNQDKVLLKYNFFINKVN